ncbi:MULTISPECIES: hypothetical protein [unclassified Micromonospora]|uniref:hypothetical protein n=1 Tax=unclassified Micromonospora TaxID=2617518 RepID=UPI0010350F75|nr:MULTISPECIES: hypothetical protein [unclassified Micromonospora]QKW13587.1 hypothetical protein HUT12_12870 [Verrucosispora sp. NA02020]TBL34421.1 hypothetical protein EYA84_15550 [Verrucosispora sp. SN26_14.1]
MPIHVDDGMLNDFVAVNMTLATQAPGAAQGPINNLVIRPGHENFVVGQTLANLIRTNGSAIQARLDEIGTLSATRGQQLRAFMALTDGAETLNEMSAAEFGSRLPAF